MDKTLAEILAFSLDTSFDSLPPDVVNSARLCLVDSLGCALGGATAPGARVAESLAAHLVAPGKTGSVIGRTEGVSADLAAMWNTSMIRYLDYNDTYPGGHPSDMLGAVVALAGLVNASGIDVLTAQAIAYEVSIRLSDSVNLRNRAIDQGFGIGVGIVAGAIHLLGLSPEVGRNALSIVASCGLPLRATRAGELSDMKGTATAIASQNAVRVLWMAQAGLSGPEAPFDGRHGVLDLLEGEVAALDLQSFDQWRLPEIRMKYWPVAYNMQVTIWAGLELRRRLDWRTLERIVVHVDEFSHHESGSEPAKWDPQTRSTADHSIPYVLARALERGMVGDVFDEHLFRDPAIRELMRRIEVVVDDDLSAIWPSVMAVRIEAVTTDGRTESVFVQDAKGHPRNPFTRDDTLKKFEQLASPRLGDRTEQAFEAAWHVAEDVSFQNILRQLV